MEQTTAILLSTILTIFTLLLIASLGYIWKMNSNIVKMTQLVHDIQLRVEEREKQRDLRDKERSLSSKQRYEFLITRIDSQDKRFDRMDSALNTIDQRVFEHTKVKIGE